MEQTGNHKDKQETCQRKKETLKISEAGKIGRLILNDITHNITDLKPTKGRIYIEINLEIEDNNFFKDDESRKSKLIVEVDLKS